VKLPSKTRFVSEKLKKKFYKLNEDDDSDRKLFQAIDEAMDILEINAHAGTFIKKKLIPKEYTNYNNLWKYNLPKGWRLLYTVSKEEILIVSIIIEWFDHKDYENTFRF